MKPEFDTDMESVDRRLETARIQNEMSRINTEITLLQGQIRDMEAHDAEDGAGIGGTPRYQPRGARPRRVVPTEDQVESENVTPPRLTPQIDGLPVRSDDHPTGRGIMQPLTSTPKEDGMNRGTLTPILKGSGARFKPATFDGTGHWKDYKAHLKLVPS